MSSYFVKLIIFVFLTILVISCNESVNPYIEKPGYIVNLVMTSEDSIQQAMVYKTLKEPNAKNIGIVEKDITMTMTSDNNKYEFTTEDNLNFTSKLSLKESNKYFLKVNINDEVILSANTTVHPKLEYDYSIDLLISKCLPPNDINKVDSNPDSSIIFIENLQTGYELVPRLWLKISENVNGLEYFDYLEIPIIYYPDGYYLYNEDIPAIEIQSKDIFNIIINLADNTLDQSKITLHHFVLNINIVDPNLYNYYQSTTLFDKGYSVSLNYSSYTNIINGQGVFGNYLNVNKIFKINPNNFKNYDFNRK